MPYSYKRAPLDTMRYNVSSPSLDTMDTYLPSYMVNTVVGVCGYTEIHCFQLESGYNADTMPDTKVLIVISKEHTLRVLAIRASISICDNEISM